MSDALTIHDLDQRSDEWYAARCGMVTASVVGRLITPTTLQPADNDDSRRLTALLVAERITGHVEPMFVTADMYRGIEAEDRARDTYSEHYAQAVECGFMVRREDGLRLGYSPDGLVGDDGLLEIKAPRAKGHLLTVIAGEVPPQHMAQCQAGLLVSGREWLDYISFCGGMRLWRKRVLPDRVWQEAIKTAVAQFEQSAAQMAADYEAATEGLPMTERLDLEMVV